MPIGELDVSWVGEIVTVDGNVSDVSSFSNGFKFTLDDDSGDIILLIWLETYDAIADRAGLREQATVKVTGEIQEFENQLQIIPPSSTDVVIVHPGHSLATARATGSLTAADMGHRVAVEGQVARIEAFSSGTRVFLDDGSGEVMLLLWQNVLERLPDGVDASLAGGWLRATGRVVEYEGILEIVPALPLEVEAVSAPPSVSPQPTVPPTVSVPIGEIDLRRVGDVVDVTGKVIDTASFSNGFRFVLDDGTGEIVLLLWHNIYDGCQDAQRLNIGTTVYATGEIHEYEGELQVQPTFGGDVSVIGTGAWVGPETQIGAVSDFMGDRVTIVGRVTGFQDNDYGTIVWVGDDSGETIVFLWQNIRERVAKGQALSIPGTNVRIQGLVQEYRGAVEIVPALPIDVEVLD